MPAARAGLFCLRTSSLLRRLSTDAGSDPKLAKWLQGWVAVPEAVVTEGTDPPTALSWLRRRGPPLPEAALHKLFRVSTVRLYDPATQRVGRASKSRLLPPGATLLIPRSAVAPPADSSRGSDGGSGGSSASSSGRSGGDTPAAAARASPSRQRASECWAARLRSCLLHSDPDLLAVCKPAGLACQGGSGVAHSVDSVMAAAFAHLPGPASHHLRLVHRLDRQTTGALLLARGPDAAAWLAAAFRESSGGSGGSGRGDSSSGASIQKQYWAVVALPEGGGAHRLPAAGAISLPVPGGRGGAAAAQPALTRYRVLHRGGGLAWLELAPATGRKHQLRLHCAQGLGAAILGDGRYGAVRSGAQAAALERLQRHSSTGEAAGATAGGRGWSGSEAPLFLHCRSLAVRKPGAGRRQVVVTAPLPASWRALLAHQGWPLPDPD